MAAQNQAPQGESEAEAIPDRLGDFVIDGVLGRGGSGVVYSARLGEQAVALKVLRPDEVPSGKERQRFMSEANMMARIDHPNVVRVLATGELDDGRPYLAMERLEGINLAVQLGGGPLPPAQALALFDQLASAVATLHGSGLIHRDLKPENVMWTHVGAVLLDFGIARETEAPPSTTTRAGMQRGTPAYMAPERFFGARATPRSDIYELALVLYVMLVGRLPWDDPSDARQRLEPKRPADHGVDIPPSVEAALLAALSSDADERPGSVAELAGQIRLGYHAGSAVLAPPTTNLRGGTPEATPDPDAPAASPQLGATTQRSKRGLAYAGIAVGVVAAIMVAVLVATSGSDEAPAPAAAAIEVFDAGLPQVVAVSPDAAVIAASHADAAAAVAPRSRPSPPKSRPPRKKRSSRPKVKVAASRKPDTKLRAAAGTRPGSGPAPLVGPNGTTYVPVKRHNGITKLPWCRKLRDIYCTKAYVATKGGPKACENMKKMVRMSERLPPPSTGAQNANCKNLYGKMLPRIKRHIANHQKQVQGGTAPDESAPSDLRER